LHRGKRCIRGESPMPIAEVDSAEGAISEGLELCVGAGRARTNDEDQERMDSDDIRDWNEPTMSWLLKI
jgi:hypothetical protein